MVLSRFLLMRSDCVENSQKKFYKKIKRQNFGENKGKFTTNWELEFYRDATRGIFEFW